MSNTPPPFDDGGAAFPSAENDHLLGETGMSLRDYYAGQALTGMTNAEHGSRGVYMDEAKKRGIMAHEFVAKCCYNYADAMIAERKRYGGRDE